MCSDFLADINNNHAKECRMDWGPKFVSGIKAIAALGQLLLVTHSDFDVSILEIPGSYNSHGKLLTIGEKVQSCSGLYQEAFAKSEQSLSKLSGTAWELASSRGSVCRSICMLLFISESILIINPASSCNRTVSQR